MQRARKHSAIFQFARKDIQCNFWSCTDGETAPDTVIFLGAGQVGTIPRWVAEATPKGVVVVDGLPHWEANPSAEDIEEFSAHYIRSVFRIVLETFNMSSMHIIAESQAALGAIHLTGSMPHLVCNLALIRPLGFTVHSFGSNPDERLRTFKRRVIGSYLQFSQSLLHDPRNLLVAITLMRAILSEPSLKVLNKKYAAGVSYDAIEDCQRAANEQIRKGNSFTILLSEHDKVFPPSEVQETLKLIASKNIDVVIVPKTSHASLAVRASKGILHQAIRAVRSD